MEKEIAFLKDYAFKLGRGAQLDLEGECGFGRECVGIVCSGNWVDYDEDIGTPKDAYHKHNCLAVLGRGDDAVQQLYDWCIALQEAGYTRVKIRQNPILADVPIQTRQMMSMFGQVATPVLVKP